MTFLIINKLCTIVVNIVVLTWFARSFRDLGWEPPGFVSRLFFNLRPLYLPALMVQTGYDIRSGGMDAMDYVLTAILWAAWFSIRNEKDDDDRWKRRREKLAAKVQQTGGKLVVVPVGSNA